MSLSVFGFNTPKLRVFVPPAVVNNVPGEAPNDPDLVRSYEGDSAQNIDSFITYADTTGKVVKRGRMSETPFGVLLTGDMDVQGGGSFQGDLNLSANSIINVDSIDGDTGTIDTLNSNSISVGNLKATKLSALVAGDVIEIDSALSTGSGLPVEFPTGISSSGSISGTLIGAQEINAPSIFSSTSIDANLISATQLNTDGIGNSSNNPILTTSDLDLQGNSIFNGLSMYAFLYEKQIPPSFPQSETIIQFTPPSANSVSGLSQFSYAAGKLTYNHTRPTLFQIQLSFRAVNENETKDRYTVTAGIYREQGVTPDQPLLSDTTVSEDVTGRDSRILMCTGIIELQPGDQVWPVIELNGAGASQNIGLRAVSFQLNRLF
jgi:hypothetical protein